jgi:hypothetical protein
MDIQQQIDLVASFSSGREEADWLAAIMLFWL